MAMRNLKQIWRDDSGTSVIEMGMIAPVLSLLLIGMVDLSMAYSEKLRLEQAAQSAIEKVMQRSGDAGTTIGTLKAEAAAQAGVDTDNVTVDYWLECNGVRSADYNAYCADGAAYARYIQVKVVGTYEPMFPSKYWGASDDGNYHVTGHAGIRTQ